jgi:RNA polymerase sigma factor (sigma-70 family)
MPLKIGNHLLNIGKVRRLPQNDRHMVSAALALKAQAGDKRALNELIINMRGLVCWVARNAGIPKHLQEDCIQEGIFGIYKALKLHKPQISKFTNYAVFHILSAMQSYVARNNCFTQLSATSYSKYKLLIKIIDGNYTDKDLKRLKNRHNFISNGDPADLKSSHFDTIRLMRTEPLSRFTREATPRKESINTENQMMDMVNKVFISCLSCGKELPCFEKNCSKTNSVRYHRMMAMKYGFDGNGGMTLEKIAEEYGLTKARAQQIMAMGIQLYQKLIIRNNPEYRTIIKHRVKAIYGDPDHDIRESNNNRLRMRKTTGT